MPDMWQAVALSKDIRKKPLRIFLDGQPLVLFRGKTGVTALTDRCPHRSVPLSDGKIVDGTIQCPYHGWRFDESGECVEMPGTVNDIPRCRVACYRVFEASGVLYVSRGRQEEAPYTHLLAGEPTITRLVKSSTNSRLIDVAENILDATHTHFTHKGLLRGMTGRRFKVEVEVTGGQGWVQATYTGEDRQQGLVSALLDGARVRTVGRYRHPGIAELEYWGPNGLVLVTTFHLRQATEDVVEGIGFLVGPRDGFFSHLKALAFKPMFNVALAQDQKVLTQAYENQRMFSLAEPLVGPLDFLRKDIGAIMNGDLPEAAREPRRYEMML